MSLSREGSRDSFSFQDPAPEGQGPALNKANYSGNSEITNYFGELYHNIAVSQVRRQLQKGRKKMMGGQSPLSQDLKSEILNNIEFYRSFFFLEKNKKKLGFFSRIRDNFSILTSYEMVMKDGVKKNISKTLYDICKELNSPLIVRRKWWATKTFKAVLTLAALAVAGVVVVVATHGLALALPVVAHAAAAMSSSMGFGGAVATASVGALVATPFFAGLASSFQRFCGRVFSRGKGASGSANALGQSDDTSVVSHSSTGASDSYEAGAQLTDRGVGTGLSSVPVSASLVVQAGEGKAGGCASPAPLPASAPVAASAPAPVAASAPAPRGPSQSRTQNHTRSHAVSPCDTRSHAVSPSHSSHVFFSCVSDCHIILHELE